jgi:hypothetical protein
MTSREIVKTALHVLVAWMNGREPASADIAVLQNAVPSSAHLPPDELACQVIRYLSGRAAFRESREERSPHQQLTDDVAGRETGQ